MSNDTDEIKAEWIKAAVLVELYNKATPYNGIGGINMTASPLCHTISHKSRSSR